MLHWVVPLPSLPCLPCSSLFCWVLGTVFCSSLPSYLLALCSTRSCVRSSMHSSSTFNTEQDSFCACS